MKKSQINQYLINILEKPNNVFINNWFGKIIIKKNKNKVKLSTNCILNKFLIEIIVFNIISFAKTREVINKKYSTTQYSNYHLVVNNTINISNLVQLLIDNSVFKKQLSQNYNIEITNLFIYKIAKIISKYFCINIRYI